VSIRVTSISKRFGDAVALDDVSLEVESGSLTALLGPSGGGKSTLLRIIAGLDTPDSGTVRIEGEDLTDAPARQRGVGFCFQHYAPFRHLTVRRNVAFGLEIRHRPKAEVKARVDELLELVGLAHLAERYPSQLSGGQRQRMALARALAVELAPHNVQVNGIVPGFFRTAMNAALIEDAEFSAWVARRTPAGRWGEPPEIAGAAVFLASAAADYVTGHLLAVDGGFGAAY